jgi:hypothetical protein
MSNVRPHQNHSASNAALGTHRFKCKVVRVLGSVEARSDESSSVRREALERALNCSPAQTETQVQCHRRWFTYEPWVLRSRAARPAAGCSPIFACQGIQANAVLWFFARQTAWREQTLSSGEAGVGASSGPNESRSTHRASTQSAV